MIEVDKFPNLYANRTGIRTVIRNLISNAIKYQPKNMLNRHIPLVQILYIKAQYFHRIIIKDNGIGIDKAFMPNLFLPFKRGFTKNDYLGTISS